MRTRILPLLMALMLTLSLTPHARADGGTVEFTPATIAVVNNPNPADRLNLRTKPSQDAPTLGKYYNGTAVEVLSGDQNGWVKVLIADLEGYMMTAFLAYPEQLDAGASAPPAVTIHNTGGTGLNLRQAQSTQSASRGLYPNGSTVWVLGVSESWCHVQTEDGRTGFMLREQLSPVLPYQQDDRGAIVNNPHSLDRLNLRTQPSQDAPTLGKYYSGTAVEVLSGDQDGWTKVRIHSLEGYMMTSYLAFGVEPDAIASAMPAVQISNAGGTGLHLRQAQSTGAPSLGLYDNGSTVTVYGVSESWCHVQTADGQAGFMLREHLSPTPDFQRPAEPTGSELEGSWFGQPGDPITNGWMPGGNG